MRPHKPKGPPTCETCKSQEHVARWTGNTAWCTACCGRQVQRELLGAFMAVCLSPKAFYYFVNLDREDLERRERGK